MSDYLLDTNALIWWLGEPERLSKRVCDLLIADENPVFVSAVSAWEIELKSNLGKLEAPDNLEKEVRVEGFVDIPINFSDGATAGALPLHHKDPFDRLLIAQALNRNLTIITSDVIFADYGVPVLKAIP